ncbi:MAG: hypothetical protein A2928_00850 [Candidatus Taylorbacteria bacterium RIFCSPLOWO2_01_FULL_45_15b]|uniref:Uncharacterized protein n=1 Tax=Candidatus Taylorbacteria bacterium RIFCSPLOWO2_01_FULL_45_15b TaxID=1802319 RepID=A0A1G2NBT7_9BACT|nr:MAG: hypothetical protein A2928_00850 [Candidatus Taylorbacteria bacterium RIFCSPLOWO2_01_FULL_45_15b]
MPHISKKKLAGEIHRKIERDLFLYITKGTPRVDMQTVMRELLTQTEIMMLAKRLAVIFLISRGASLYEIQMTLAISPSTAARFLKDYEIGKFDHLKLLLETPSSHKLLHRLIRAWQTRPRKIGKRYEWFNELQ